MAKRTIYTSDCIEGIEFRTQEEQEEFDKSIQDKEFYIEFAKAQLEDYIRYYCSDPILSNGKIVVELTETLTNYCIGVVECNGIAADIYPEFCEYIDDDCEDIIFDYIIEKFKEFSNDIESLVNKLEVQFLSAS